MLHIPNPIYVCMSLVVVSTFFAGSGYAQTFARFGAMPTRLSSCFLEEHDMWENCSLYTPFNISSNILIDFMLDPPDSSPARLTEVAWQVAWWSLVPLAIGAMTQPCGKVLGRREENFRFYSRASPIVCIADVAHFLLLVGLGFSLDRRVFWRNFKFEVRGRFADGVDDRWQAGKTRLMRWSLMVLGGIPCQTIKLVAMDGLFWTKTWALMFLVSIVFGEVVLLLALHFETNHVIDLAKPKWRRQSWMKFLDLAFHVPFTCHCHVVYSVAATLFYWLLFSVSAVNFYLATSVCVAVALVLQGLMLSRLFGSGKVAFIRAIASYLVLMAVWELLQKFGWQQTTSRVGNDWKQYRLLLDHYLRKTRNPPKDHLANVLLPWTDITLGLRSETFSHVMFLGYEVLAAACISILVPSFFHITPLQNALQIDSVEATYAVFICLSSLFLSLAWYCVMFQSRGTHNPPWTKIFG